MKDENMNRNEIREVKMSVRQGIKIIEMRRNENEDRNVKLQKCTNRKKRNMNEMKFIGLKMVSKSSEMNERNDKCTYPICTRNPPILSDGIEKAVFCRCAVIRRPCTPACRCAHEKLFHMRKRESRNARQNVYGTDSSMEFVAKMRGTPQNLI